MYLITLFIFSNVKPFIKKLNNNVVNPTIKKAAQHAEDTLSLAREQRSKLVKCLPSDEEESPEEEGQSMQLDGESLDKALNSQKRKNADHHDDDDSDEEVIGRKVHIENVARQKERPCTLAKNIYHRRMQQ